MAASHPALRDLRGSISRGWRGAVRVACAIFPNTDRGRPIRYSALSLKDLICLCAGPRDDDAWEEFVSRVGKPIALTIMRTASLWGETSRSVVEDLVQDTYIKLWKDGCRLLRDFAIEHPEAALGYIKKTAANTAHDYFKHRRSQKSGGDKPHVLTIGIDPKAGQGVRGSQKRFDFGVLLNEIDEHLKHCLTEPDQERDRMIFWGSTSGGE